MARKRTDAVPEQPPVQSEALQPNAAAEPVSDTDGNGAAEAPKVAPAAPKPDGRPRKPDQAFKVFSDRTTCLEVAIWENEIRYDDRVSVQHSISLSRSFKNAEGKWVPSTSYRAHDLPLVRVLLEMAHTWAVRRRTDDSSIPF